MNSISRLMQLTIFEPKRTSAWLSFLIIFDYISVEGEVRPKFCKKWANVCLISKLDELVSFGLWLFLLWDVNPLLHVCISMLKSVTFYSFLIFEIPSMLLMLSLKWTILSLFTNKTPIGRFSKISIHCLDD